MPERIPPADLVALAHDAAGAHALWPELVCAIIEQESGWNRWAARYEPAFYKRYIEPMLARPGGLAKSDPPTETEARMRAFSWGSVSYTHLRATRH